MPWTSEVVLASKAVAAEREHIAAECLKAREKAGGRGSGKGSDFRTSGTKST